MQTEIIRFLFNVKNSLAKKKISKLNVYVFSSYVNKLILRLTWLQLVTQLSNKTKQKKLKTSLKT